MKSIITSPPGEFVLWSDLNPEPHHCPPWCHACPDIEFIVRGQGAIPGPLDIMGWCPSGQAFGVDACVCSREDPHISPDVLARAIWFAKKRERERHRERERRSLLPPDELRARRRRSRS